MSGILFGFPTGNGALGMVLRLNSGICCEFGFTEFGEAALGGAIAGAGGRVPDPVDVL